MGDGEATRSPVSHGQRNEFIVEVVHGVVQHGAVGAVSDKEITAVGVGVEHKGKVFAAHHDGHIGHDPFGSGEFLGHPNGELRRLRTIDQGGAGIGDFDLRRRAKALGLRFGSFLDAPEHQFPHLGFQGADSQFKVGFFIDHVGRFSAPNAAYGNHSGV